MSVEIRGSVWFTQYGKVQQIGIVLTWNGYEEKAKIGVAPGTGTKEADEQNIAATGASFPLKTAKDLIGGA